MKKNRWQRFCCMVVAGLLGVSILSGCGADQTPTSQNIPDTDKKEEENTMDTSVYTRYQDILTGLNVYTMEQGVDLNMQDDTQFMDALGIVMNEVRDLTTIDTTVQSGDADFTISQDTLSAFGSVLRNDFTQLPDASAGTYRFITNQQDGTYKVSYGEKGACRGEITAWDETDDGFVVNCSLIDAITNEVMVSVRYTLTANTYDNTIAKTYLPYTITNMEAQFPSDDLTGVYASLDEDGSTVTLTEKEDGTYTVDIRLEGLIRIEDGIGVLEDDVIAFTGSDALGDPISGSFSFEEEHANLVISDSTWQYLPNGSSYLFQKEAAEITE